MSLGMGVDVRIRTLGLAVYPPGAVLRDRTMRDYEFVWIIDGEVTWVCDGERHSAPPGAVILERPGMHTGYDWDLQKQTRHAYFHFDIVKKPTWLPGEAGWPICRRMPEGDIIRPLFRQIAALWEHRTRETEALLSNAAGHLLASYVTDRIHTRGEGGTVMPEAVERAMRYVQEQWKDGHLRLISLDDLAHAAAVSPGHLCRLFQQSFGYGPIEVLRLARLDRAGSMLARTNLRVQEIGSLMGFESAFHFSRAFKTLFGDAPREFRKRIASGHARPVPKLASVRAIRGRLWGAF